MKWPDWSGATVVVVGNGPSRFTPESKIDSTLIRRAHVCRDCRLIVCNRAYEDFPLADWLHGYDEAFWNSCDAAKTFPGIKTTGEGIVPGTVRKGHMTSGAVRSLAPGLVWLPMTDKNKGAPFADPEIPVHRGRESGYQATQFPAMCGARRVLLFGMDARPESRFDKQKGVQRTWAQSDCDQQIRLHREKLAPAMKARGVEVINCTPGSAIDAYPMAPLEDVL